jgi:glycosyltransferase involved in cell wall biosynthesis
MKIAYLMQAGLSGFRKPPYSGPANHAREVIIALEEMGHQVGLLASWDGVIYRSDDLENFEPVVVRSYDRAALRLIVGGVRRLQSMMRLPYFAFFDSLRFALACYQELKGFDLLYERIGWMSYGSGLAARWLGIPLILEENGNQMTHMETLGIAPQGLQRRVSLALMKRAMHRATHVVASGDGWRDHFIERWEVAPEKVTTVENGTMLVGMLDRSQLRSFRTPDGSPSEPPTLVYLGGFYPWHGVSILIQALAKVLECGVQARLWMIGAGASMDEAKQLVSELKINDAVTFTGSLPATQFAPMIAQADIGLSPYCGWVEFSGMKIFDYKAAGLAIIASGKDGRPATIKHGQTGWIVPPCDVDALCEAIVHLCEHAELRRHMGQQARIEAENTHAWKHTAQRLDVVFRKLVEHQSEVRQPQAR